MKRRRIAAELFGKRFFRIPAESGINDIPATTRIHPPMAETFTKVADDWVKATRPDGTKASGVRVGASRLGAARLLTVQETGRKLWPTVETPSAAVFLLSQALSR